MTLAGLLAFCLAYLLATASPGPGVAALVARVLARGPSGLSAMIAGYVVGDLVWFALAVAGLALLLQVYAPVFAAIRWAGVLYLLYLAWRFWTAPAERPSGEAPAGEGVALFGQGLAITLGNPKVILFFVALLPSVVDMDALTPLAAAEIAVLIVLILGSVLAAYAGAAARARKLFTSPRAVRLVNRSAGAAMAGAAAAIAAR